MTQRLSPDEFVRRTERQPSGCLLWIGPKADRYGTFGRRTYAHRYAYEQAFGPIEAHLYVLHRCDVPLCVEPTHLFLGTQKDNMADMIAKGRQVKPMLLREACPSGHRYDFENTTLYRGERRCRTCNRERTRSWRAARKAG